MKVSDHILGLIKLFEGYTPVAMQMKGDRKGVITGGYGTITHITGKPVCVGDIFTESYALECLEFEINNKCKKLNYIITAYHVSLNQNQFDALACFIYNVGDGKLNIGTTMGDAINSNDKKQISDAFMVYTKGTVYVLGIPIKKDLPGLVARRKAERDLFNSSVVEAAKV